MPKAWLIKANCNLVEFETLNMYQLFSHLVDCETALNISDRKNEVSAHVIQWIDNIIIFLYPNKLIFKIIGNCLVYVITPKE